MAGDEDLDVGEAAVSALLFDDLDGSRRLAPLAVIERIEPVPAEAIRHSAGRLRLSIEGRIVPLVALGDWQDRGEIPVLRLRDGDAEIAYAIGEALDIVTLPEGFTPATQPGPVAGVVPLHQDQIELLDVHWLFATHAEDAVGAAPPVCLLDGAESAWMATFLKPALEAAGYRVVSRLRRDQKPAVVLTMDGQPGTGNHSAPVVRLRRERGGAEDGSIYRYDRGALIAAMAAAGGRA